jgi:Mg-chelatase subunit ChlI
MLSFYLAFLYSGREYFNTDRIICMSQFLFDVQQENRLKQSGLLKRFSINCYGHQETVEEMRAEKSEKHKELKGKRDDPEFEEWFLRYRPSDKMNVENKPIQKKDKKRNTDNKDKTYKKSYSVKRPSSNSKTSSNNKKKKNKMMKRIFGKKFTKGTKGIKGKERGRGGLFV